MILTCVDLKTTAVFSAEIQPKQVKNGYVFKLQQSQRTVDYEPHLFRAEAAIRQWIARVDVARSQL